MVLQTAQGRRMTLITREGTSGSCHILQPPLGTNPVPPSSPDMLLSVNQCKPQQGQSKQTVRDMGSCIHFTLTTSLQSNRKKSFLISPASLILHTQVVTTSISNIQATQCYHRFFFSFLIFFFIIIIATFEYRTA